MLLFLMLFILYGIPMLLGIFLIRWILTKHSTKRRANLFAIASIGILLVVGIGISIKDKMNRTHHMSYSFCGDLIMELTAFEEEGFQDYPISLELVLKDAHGEVITEKLLYADGPYIQLTLVQHQQTTLHINGYHDRYLGIDETIELKGVQSFCNDQIRINDNFEIE